MATDGLELSLAVRTEVSDWIDTDTVEEAHVRTDAEGTATVPWAPREKLKYVAVHIISPDWKIEKKDNGQTGEGITPWRESAIFDGCWIARSGGSSPTRWTGLPSPFRHRWPRRGLWG
jgi:hypothetical protein